MSVSQSVSPSVSPSLLLFRFDQIILYPDKRIVNTMKVYIELNNMQVELIRFRKHIDFTHVYFCEASNAMQYRPPKANLLKIRRQHRRGCQTAWSHLAGFVRRSTLSPDN